MMETAPDENPTGETRPAMLTTRSVQRLLNVDRSTVYRMAEDGRLTAVKVGRQWRFHAEAIDQWLADLNGRSADSPALERSLLESPFDSSRAQAIADLAADLLGVMIFVTDMEGRALCSVSNPCGLHLAVANRPRVRRLQLEELRNLRLTSGLTSHLIPSYLGLLCARSFIRSGTELTGMVIAGGIAPEEWPPPEKLGVLADRLDISIEALLPHLDEVFHLDESGQQRVVEALPKVADLLSRVAFAGDAPVGASEPSQWSPS